MVRILVVDDNPDIRTFLVLLFQRAGHDAIEVADSTTVLTWVEDTDPDVIILDVTVPGMHAWETLAMLKSDPMSKDIPVIISSAPGDYEHLDRARALGAADYILKPWTAADILTRVLWAATARPDLGES